MTTEAIARSEGMRREQFTLTVTDVAWVDGDEDPSLPCLHITFDGEPSVLRSRLVDAHGDPLEDDAIDVTVRLQGAVEDAGTDGVVAMTSRVTGDYLLEAAVTAPDVIAFTRAARRYGEHADGASRYLVRLRAEGESIGEFEKRTLLVYSHDGDLLRHHSLIPSGVEI